MKTVLQIASFLLAVLFACHANAQGIKGFIADEKGDALPFASIYIQEAGTGTSSNADGFYELRLAPGTYKVTFQYLGFEAQTQTVNVAADYETVNVKLHEQSIVLNTVTVTSGGEDPAYTIMRKAISKAKFHLLQTDSYTARVYIKGTGGVKKIPWMFRKRLKEEGIDTNRVFTSESVSEISFKRPNTFKEKIISVRVSGADDNNVSPNGYINSSFYLPIVVNAVSPLSPKAFSYYRFVYLGSFEDRGFVINKIQVIPRSRGEQVFEGVIYIRDNYWNIHSLNLSTKIESFNMTVVQIFGPVLENIWMPVTQKYNFAGELFGFEFEYNYLASVSKYNIVPNNDLNPEIELLDEKIDDVPAEVKEAKIVKSDTKKELKKEDKKVTNKQLEQMIDEYEEQEQAANEEEKNVVSDYWYEVDSTAKKKDSVYWAEIRPVPLTEKEVEGYKAADSTYVAEKADSLDQKHGGALDVGTILMGGKIKMTEHTNFRFAGILPQLRFNTVEGFNQDLTGTFTTTTDSGAVFTASPFVRYGLSSEQFYGKLNTGLAFGKPERRNSFALEGGKYIYQFNPEAINPLVNSLWSLFFARNYMKLYEKEYAALFYAKQLSYAYFFRASAEFASRSELFNTTNFSFFRPGENWYTANKPLNSEANTGGFEAAKALKTTLAFTAQPWLKFRKYNGKIRPIKNSSPEFLLTYNAGWAGVLKSTTNFHQLELGVKHDFKVGVRATIDFNVEAGTFLHNKNLQFMDFKHFNGGLTEIAPMQVANNYRLLDYYIYSTKNSYVSLFSHFRFRKLLFTHIPLVRLSGVKENLFLNYLKTDFSPNYFEVGYTIDNIFRFFRLEFVQSFNDFTPNQFGIRIGVSTAIGNN